MAELKNFLDYQGLIKYDELIKAYIDAQKGQDETNLNQVIADLAAVTTRVDTNETNIATNTAAIETLNGDGEGSVSKSVSDAIANLVDSAPETFDTLKEIADWISSDETASAELVARVAQNESDIADLKTADSDLKAYVDTQDKSYYDSISSIAEVKVNSLFLEPVSVAADQTVQEAIDNLEEGQKLVLDEDSAVAEDLSVPENAYIDANGSTFSGTVTIPESATIENAVFTGKVTIG